MAIHRFLSSFSYLLLLQISITAFSIQTTATDFIRTSCSKTSYPDLCYTSLSCYANAVKRDSAKLARISIAVSLFRTHRMALHAVNLSRSADNGSDHLLAGAIHDCVSVYGDAVGQIRDSLNRMRRIMNRPVSGELLRLGLNDVQTWMSAAVTNEDTCMDGFEGVEDGEMKLDVCHRSRRVKMMTINALALVNSYADEVSSSSPP